MPMKTFIKTFTCFMLFLFCFSFCFGQNKIEKTNIVQFKNNNPINSDKSNWVGGNSSSNTLWLGANPSGGSEIFIMGSDPLFGFSAGQKITKVRFLHYKGIKNFSEPVGAQNFDNTIYTIEIYKNPTFNMNFYGNVYHTAIGTPIYTEQFDLSTTSNGVYEATLGTAYEYDGAPFLVGIKFNNGRALVPIDSVYNPGIDGGLFYAILLNSSLNNSDATPDVNGNVLYELTDNGIGWYDRYGIELFIDDGMSAAPICDIETMFSRTNNTIIIDSDTTINGSSNFQFKIAAWNFGPDIASGTFTYKINAEGHNLLSQPTGTSNLTIPSQTGYIVGNTITLTAANMNAWGLIEFDITAEVNLGGTTIDPDENNNIAKLHIIRTIPSPDYTTPLFTPINNAQNVLLSTPIQVEFPENIIAGTSLPNISITPSCGTITTQIQGKILKIFHSDALKYDTQYTILVQPNNLYLQPNAFSWTFKTIVPTPETYLPLQNATNVSTTTTISLTFTLPIANGTEINNVLISSAEYGTEANVSANTNGKVLTITHDAFAYNTTYTVTIPANAIANIATPYSWNFKTGTPSPQTYIPAENATNVAITTLISLSFSLPVAEGTNFDNIELSSGEFGQETITKSIDISGYILNINNSNPLEYNTIYTVTIPANAIENITNPITWSFTTKEGINVPINLTNDLDIYPNPATNELRIINYNPQNNNNLAIYDIYGKEILNISIENTTSPIINISNLSSGIYFVKLEDNGQIKTKKLIIE